MKNQLSTLTWTSRTAFSVLILGLGALVLGDPYVGERVTMNVMELALIVQSESDHISVHELADWIIEDKADYRLIDVRSESEYLAYHIPGSENISISELATANIERNEKIIVYSEGGIHAAQAWMLLAARGYKQSYVLTGGLEEWRNSILFPNLHVGQSAVLGDSIARVQAVCEFFGGSIQSDQPSPDSTPDAPQVHLPKSSSGQTLKGATVKKKKEGC